MITKQQFQHHRNKKVYHVLSIVKVKHPDGGWDQGYLYKRSDDNFSSENAPQMFVRSVDNFKEKFTLVENKDAKE